MILLLLRLLPMMMMMMVVVFFQLITHFIMDQGDDWVMMSFNNLMKGSKWGGMVGTTDRLNCGRHRKRECNTC